MCVCVGCIQTPVSPSSLTSNLSAAVKQCYSDYTDLIVDSREPTRTERDIEMEKSGTDDKRTSDSHSVEELCAVIWNIVT